MAAARLADLRAPAEHSPPKGMVWIALVNPVGKIDRTRQAASLLRFILVTWYEKLAKGLDTANGLAGFFNWLCDPQTGNGSSLGFYKSMLDAVILPVVYLVQAFGQLAAADTDMVLRPCEDGGHYLIGWKRPHAGLVRGVRMSTDRVLRDTLAQAEAEGLHVSLLPPWYDIDDMEDLQKLRADLTGSTTDSRHTLVFLERHLASPGTLSQTQNGNRSELHST